MFLSVWIEGQYIVWVCVPRGGGWVIDHLYSVPLVIDLHHQEFTHDRKMRRPAIALFLHRSDYEWLFGQQKVGWWDFWEQHFKTQLTFFSQVQFQFSLGERLLIISHSRCKTDDGCLWKQLKGGKYFWSKLISGNLAKGALPIKCPTTKRVPSACWSKTSNKIHLTKKTNPQK